MSTEYEIQGHYRNQWEMVTTVTTQADALDMLGTYRLNEPGTAFRIKAVNVVRPLSEIAREIIADYPKAGNENHPAGAYVVPMASLDKITDAYYADTADSIVRYALSNLAGWRGETARRVKAELKGMLK